MLTISTHSSLILASRTDQPSWADRGGVPTPHVARAAVQVAAVLDQHGSRVVDADESYWRRATGGVYAPPDLRLGQQLLVEVGLVEERDGMLYPTAALSELVDLADDESAAALAVWVADQKLETEAVESAGAALAATLDQLLDDPARREQMLVALGRRFDDTYQRLLGEIGEELVVAAARCELDALGYPELATAVRRISLATDQAGYDITAPRVMGNARLLEVKATSTVAPATGIHLTRNELETGSRYADDWALVVCRITDVQERKGEIVGWTNGPTLSEVAPHDTESGQWESAFIRVPIDALVPGLPSAAGGIA